MSSSFIALWDICKWAMYCLDSFALLCAESYDEMLMAIEILKQCKHCELFNVWSLQIGSIKFSSHRHFASRIRKYRKKHTYTDWYRWVYDSALQIDWCWSIFRCSTTLTRTERGRNIRTYARFVLPVCAFFNDFRLFSVAGKCCCRYAFAHFCNSNCLFLSLSLSLHWFDFESEMNFFRFDISMIQYCFHNLKRMRLLVHWECHWFFPVRNS